MIRHRVALSCLESVRLFSKDFLFLFSSTLAPNFYTITCTHTLSQRHSGAHTLTHSYTRVNIYRIRTSIKNKNAFVLFSTFVSNFPRKFNKGVSVLKIKHYNNGMVKHYVYFTNLYIYFSYVGTYLESLEFTRIFVNSVYSLKYSTVMFLFNFQFFFNEFVLPICMRVLVIYIYTRTHKHVHVPMYQIWSVLKVVKLGLTSVYGILRLPKQTRNYLH